MVSFFGNTNYLGKENYYLDIFLLKNGLNNKW